MTDPKAPESKAGGYVPASYEYFRESLTNSVFRAPPHQRCFAELWTSAGEWRRWDQDVFLMSSITPEEAKALGAKPEQARTPGPTLGGADDG